MDALVMSGGRGTRLDYNGEKPMYEIGGEPMIERVLNALEHSSIGQIKVAVSPHTPETREHVEKLGAEVLETRGEGYVEDLKECLENEVETPVMTVVSDLPLLDPDIVNEVLEEYENLEEEVSVSVCTTLEFCEGLGIEPDTSFGGLVPTGVNIVGDSNEDEYMVINDVRLSVNVNTLSDAIIAEEKLNEKPKQKTTTDDPNEKQ